jgi:hypothetical protein
LASNASIFCEWPGSYKPPLKSMNGYHRLRCSRRSKTASIGESGRNEPLPFRSKRPVNRLLGCGHRFRFDCRLAHDHCARNRSGPFPDAALDALNDGIFDVPVFHHEPRFCGTGWASSVGYTPRSTSSKWFLTASLQRQARIRSASRSSTRIEPRRVSSTPSALNV